MQIKLFIYNKDSVYEVSDICKDEIVYASEIGMPSYITFNILRDVVQRGKINFVEGDVVKLFIDGKAIFMGYVFEKQRTDEQIIGVKAYDQTRYLKNRDSIQYEFITLSALIKRIADSYKLNCGELEQTGYILPLQTEDNKTLLDIIYNAMYMTFYNTGERFIFYDDCGRLTLKNIKNMRLPLIMSDEGSLIGYEYYTGIENDTFNRVKLRQSLKGDIVNEFVLENKATQGDWGILQYFENVSSKLNSAQIAQRAEHILKEKNRVLKKITVEDFGDIRVRAGCSVRVKVDFIGEVSLDDWFLVKKCKHIFSNSLHTMKIEMGG